MDKKQNGNRPLTEEEAVFVENLILENSKTIKNIIYNVLGENFKYLAEDAITEVYLLVCQKIDVLKKHSSPKAWVFVAARYVAQATVRNNKKHENTLSLDEIEERATDLNVEEEAIYKIWLSDKVPEKLIKRLTKGERQVYQKLYVEQKTPKQAAEELGIAPSSIYNFNVCIREKIINAVKHKKF